MNNIWYEQDLESNISVNTKYQSQIEKWLKTFPNNYTGLIISGGIGTGKNTIVKNSIKNSKWKYHTLYLENDKSWDFFSNFITGLNEKMVLVINDANLISSPSEKRNILEFFTQNAQKKFLPIIFLTNLNHSKLISTLALHDSENIRVPLPNENDLLMISKIYIEKYNLRFDSLQTLKDILNYSQYDIRRLIIILQDLYYTFVLNTATRKITRAVSRIAMGLQEKLFLGNLDSQRDWGHAKDYVEAMYLMLQNESARDYVISSGHTYSVKYFCELAFNTVGLDYKKYVYIDPEFYRPAEVDYLRGNSSLAAKELSWAPKISFVELVKDMVNNDIIRYQ
jgi:hypothetical protein